ncbi:hypothetical protein LCGC14_1455360 [marine sediment metagenome]|uniref:Uncharacterized protein n=1 Tax=marine sediment metagenome TaxID=412755 RepID=A0A0F9MII6_9ZZZZ
MNKPLKPPPAVVCNDASDKYIVVRNDDRQKIVSGVIVIFPEHYRWLQPIVAQLGLKQKADELALWWEQINKDKADMENAND